MAKKVSITMSPLMKEVGSNVLNPTVPYSDVEYEKILSSFIPDASKISAPDFSDIDEFDSDDLLVTSQTQKPDFQFKANTTPLSPTETGAIFETPSKHKTGTNHETRTKIEGPTTLDTGIIPESPTRLETGAKHEGPTKTEAPAKMKGANLINIDINLIEREKLTIDCIRLEAIVSTLWKSRKKKEEWIPVSRDTLIANKVNGARLASTRVMCKARGFIDYKIEHEGINGKERYLYRVLKQ